MIALQFADSPSVHTGALCALVLALLGWGLAPPRAQSQSVTPSEEEMRYYTAEWEGDRYPEGRPMVPAGILGRMENVSIEQAWSVLRQHDYHNKFAGEWEMIHEDRPIIGRALTAQYMPRDPNLDARIRETGQQNGHVGSPNSWPIDMLQQGDVYVADGYSKVKDGTLIGDNLGTAIYSNSGNGVVFNGSLRDLGGLEEIDGFNAFVRGWHPSFIQEMMLTGINMPIRIGEAVVLPGDVVLARREGVLFIPPHLAEEVVETAEIVVLRDMFGQQRLREGVYTPGQIDSQWSEEIRQDFLRWLEANVDSLPVPEERIQEILTERNW